MINPEQLLVDQGLLVGFVDWQLTTYYSSLIIYVLTNLN